MTLLNSVSTFALALCLTVSSAFAGTAPVLGKAEGGIGNATGDLSSLTVLPSNGSSARKLSDFFADQINLKAIGGKNDLQSVTACAIAAGSTALNCPTATFTSADVGKNIDVTGAAGPNLTLSTTIAALVDSHDVTLAAAASRQAGPTVISAVYASSNGSLQGSRYVPGDGVTLAGGTLTTGSTGAPTQLTVASTQINAANITIVNAGSGGVVTSNCQITGTTGVGVGVGQKFVLKGTVSGGVLTSIVKVIQPGRYTTNPTNLAAEPVTTNCSLTGVTLSIQMTPLTYTISNAGAYSASPVAESGSATLPAGTAIASTTGSGTGASLNMTLAYYATGNVTYGTDNGPAIVAAVNDSNTNYAGRTAPLCIYAPGGQYGIWSGVVPTFIKGGCAYGDGTEKTVFYLGASFSGNFLSWSEAWVGGSGAFINWGAQSYRNLNSTANGPVAHDFTIAGDRSNPNYITALGLFDHNEEVDFHNLKIGYITGPCLDSGTLLNKLGAYTRESYFANIRCYFSGTSTVAAVRFTGQGLGQGPNELRVFDLNIFAPLNTGLEVSSYSTLGGVGAMGGSIAFHTVRVEGWAPPANQSEELLKIIGVSSISMDDLLINSTYPGYAGVRIDAAPSGPIPFNISLQGAIGGAYGAGVNLVNGRAISLKMGFGQQQQAINIGSSSNVLAPVIIDDNGAENTLDIITDPTNIAALKWRPLTGAYTGGLSTTIPDGSVLGGSAVASGALDLSGNKISGLNGAAGIGSFILGGTNNSAAGSCGIVGGQTNTCTGTFSLVNGFRAWDRNRYGVHCSASGFFLGSVGEAESCDATIRTLTTSTTQARLLTDGTGTVNTNPGDCFPIPLHYAATMTIDLIATDDTNPGNTLSYHTLAILDHSTATTTWTAHSGNPTSVATGSVSTGAITVTADNTNSCPNIAWTAPNADTWLVTGSIHSAESGH